MLLVDARDRVRAGETEKLRGRRARLHGRSRRSASGTSSPPSRRWPENANVQGALDTYFTELRTAIVAAAGAGCCTRRSRARLERLAGVMTGARSSAILDPDGRVFASGGAAAARWAVGRDQCSSARGQTDFQSVAVPAGGAFRFPGAPLPSAIATSARWSLATSLDERLRAGPGRLAHAGIVITVNDVGGGRHGGRRALPSCRRVTGDLRATRQARRRGVSRSARCSAIGTGAHLHAVVDRRGGRGGDARCACRARHHRLRRFVLAAFASCGWRARSTDPINHVSRESRR